MVSQKITVNNPSGLHLRPAGILCNEAIKYSSAFYTCSQYTQYTLRVCCTAFKSECDRGDEIELVCEGADEQEALKALTDAISSGLGE